MCSLPFLQNSQLQLGVEPVLSFFHDSQMRTRPLFELLGNKIFHIYHW